MSNVKKINLDYKVSTSKRPEWLLRYAGDIRSYCDWVAAGDELNQLKQNSDMLNKYLFFNRKLLRSCELIKREIVGEKLRIYNVNGSSVLLEIYYN